MRVLVATNMYPTPRSPWLGIFVREQVESLRAAGVEVEVSTHIGQLSRWHYPRAPWSIARAVRRFRPDVIHCHHTYSVLAALLGRALAGLRVPIVFSWHESEIFTTRHEYGQDLLRRLKYRHDVKAFAAQHCDLLLPVEASMPGRVLGSQPLRAALQVLPAGIDLRRFTVSRAEARTRLGLAPAARIVFFPSAASKPEKRFDLTEAALAHVRRKLGPTELLVGGGIPYNDVPLYMAAANVVLLTSDYEASPTVIKEALACDTPVVSSDTGDVRAAYGDLSGVIICPWQAEDFAAGIVRALETPCPFGGRQRLMALGLDLPQVAARLIELYRNVAATPERP